MHYILSYKKLFFLLVLLLSLLSGCDTGTRNQTAHQEQQETEINQRTLLAVQPPPKLNWSLERDNLIKRFKLENDRTVMFYMYLFIEGISEPIGYYQVNKVSSVNSQLTNPMQLVKGDGGEFTMDFTIPSPAEDGSYGDNGQGVFGFTPEEIYIEHNLKYVVSTVPLSFKVPVNKLTIITVETEKALRMLMSRIAKE